MKNLASIILTTLFLILGYTLPLFAQNPLPKTDASFGQPNQQIILTPEEQAWLAGNPRITIGGSPLAPYMFTENGQIQGSLIDMMQIVVRQVGLTADYSMNPVAEILPKIQSGQLHVILGMVHSEERARIMYFSDNVMKLQMYIFARASRSDIHDVASLENKVIASVNGYGFEPVIKKFLPDAKLIRADDAEGMLRLVASGEADAAVMELYAGEFILRDNFINGVNRKRLFDPLGLPAITGSEFAVSRKHSLLNSILNKSYNAIPESEKNRVWRKWYSDHTATPAETTIALTPEEQAWLAQDHTVHVRVVNIPPYIILKKGADPTGISIDYLKLISERTGGKFKYVASGKAFPEALDGLKNHQGPDLITSLSRTPEREKSIHFSSEYIRSPYVIFTHTKGKDFISDMSDLLGKKIALPRGTTIHALVKSEYPKLDLRLFDNDAQAIEAVATQKADAYIGNLTLASFLILEKGLVDLKIAGPTPFGDHVFSLGIRNDWPELGSLADKALATISPEEQAQIRNKYISIQYEHRETAVIIKWILVIGSAASGIVLLFVLWNRSLKQQVQERTVELTDTNESLATEIEERKQAEERLRYQATLLANVSDAVVSLDNDFRVVSWNAAAERIYGWKPGAALGKVYRELTALQYLNCSREEVLDTLHQAGFWQGEVIQEKKDGQRIYIQGTVSLIKDEEGKEVGSVGVNRDISEQKNAEEALRKSEERFRATFEQAAVGIAHVAPDGTFLRLNQKFCDIVGYSQEEMQTLSFQKITHPDDLAMDLDYVQQILSGRRNSYTIEKRYVRKDSEIIWVNLTVAAVHMEESEPGWFVSVIEEISDRKQSEERVKQHQQRLKAMALQLTITEEKERRRLAADLHDHVGQSLVFSRIQLAGLKDQTSDEEFIESIDEVSQSLLGIIKDTKDLVFDLSSPLLNEIGLSAATSQWLVEQIGEKYSLETEFIDSCKILLQDDEMNALLFRNIRELLTNVIKHAFAKKIRICFENDEDKLMVTVQDDGIGFIFSRAPDMVMSRKGFGLFSIKERVEDIGGSLDIESEPGNGSKITMNIPLTRQ